MLLISYCFPPDAAVGGLRWQRLAGYLAGAGWGLDVVTMDPGPAPWGRGASGLATLPPGTRVYGIARPELLLRRAESRIHRFLNAARGAAAHLGAHPHAVAPARAVAVPTVQPPRDMPRRPGSVARDEVRWLDGGLRALVRLYFVEAERRTDRALSRRAAERAESVISAAAREGVRYSGVLSSGPPHGAHEAACLVAERTGLPLVMDMRDPWSRIERVLEHLASPAFFWWASRNERRVVERAALVIANNERAARSLREIYPMAAGRVVSITNGFDEEDALPAPPPPLADRACFRMAYAGTIYIDRDPRPLLRAVAELGRRHGLGRGELQLEFIGEASEYEGMSLGALAADAGAADYVTLTPPMPRAACHERLARAHLLVSLPQDTDLCVPAKVFEYLRFPAWLLALAERESATADVLAGTGADVVPPGDGAALVETLERRFLEFRRSGRPEPLAGSAGGRALSRSSQAGRLLDALAHVGVLARVQGAAARAEAAPAGAPPSGKAADGAVPASSPRTGVMGRA